jgi:predicted Zn-dependent protease
MTPEQRLEAFRRHLAARPDDAFARYSVGMQLKSMGRFAEAAAELGELGRRSPDYVPAWLMLGQSLEAAGRDAEAAGAYRAGIGVASRLGNHHARSELEDALERLAARAG